MQPLPNGSTMIVAKLKCQAGLLRFIHSGDLFSEKLHFWTRQTLAYVGQMAQIKK